MRFLSIMITIVFLSACASPDISAFKQSSIALSTGLKNNQTALVTSGNEITNKLNRPKPLVKSMAKMQSQGSTVEQLSAVMVTYAVSVAKLASSGEDGEKAINELVTNLQTTITTITGNNTPLPPSINALSAILGKLQQSAKNEDLHKIMEGMQTAVDGIVAALVKAPNAEKNIINGMATYWRTQRQDLIGYHQSYEKLTAKAKRLDSHISSQLNLQLSQCDSDCDFKVVLEEHDKVISQSGNKRGELEVLINRIEPFEIAYQSWTKEIADWQEASIARVSAIPKLAKAWKNDHQTIINFLRACNTATGIFDSKCGVFSAANLELFGTLLGKAAFPI